MKKVLILMLGLVASTASFAHESISPVTNAQTHLIMPSEDKLKLFVQPLQTKGQVAIWDAKGQAIYLSSISLHKGLSQQFDISNLGRGTYRLTLTTGPETITKTFVVQGNPNESFVVQ